MFKFIKIQCYIFVIITSLLLIPSKSTYSEQTYETNHADNTIVARNDKEKHKAFQGCVNQQKLGYYAKMNATNGVPKENVIRIWTARAKSQNPVGITPDIILAIIETAYLEKYKDLDKRVFTYKIFMICINH